jgi:acetoin utilization protein AcuC
MESFTSAIVYHKDYNKYDLGLTHPLIGDKPQKTMDFFRKKKILNQLKVFTPKVVSEKDILRVHNPRFLERIKHLSQTGGMITLDTPAPKGIYETARLVTGGTKLAGDKLFQKFTLTANPLAGFHHASKASTSGFCFFNDIAITIEYLREKYQLERFLIVDLDVHHANGTQEIYYDDPSVLNISFHQDGRTLYPGTGSLEKIGRDSGEGYTINLPLPPGTASQSYLIAFDELIPQLVKQFEPQVIIYQSGVDTHHSDPLANLRLVYQTYYQIGMRMKHLSLRSCDKLLVLFGGGYNSQASIISYYNLMSGLLHRKHYLSESEVQSDLIDTVSQLVLDLKKRVSLYWDF